VFLSVRGGAGTR